MRKLSGKPERIGTKDTHTHILIIGVSPVVDCIKARPQQKVLALQQSLTAKINNFREVILTIILGWQMEVLYSKPLIQLGDECTIQT